MAASRKTPKLRKKPRRNKARSRTPAKPARRAGRPRFGRLAGILSAGLGLLVVALATALLIGDGGEPMEGPSATRFIGSIPPMRPLASPGISSGPPRALALQSNERPPASDDQDIAADSPEAESEQASSYFIPDPPLPVEQPAWLRNAVAIAETGERPMIAVVIDDLGLRRSNTRRIIELPAPLTLAFLTYAEGLPELAGAAQERGHELLVHFPMEPEGSDADPGPKALMLALDQDELRARLGWGLDRFEGFVGMNNHMGSRFTKSPEAMSLVMQELRRRGLLFLDSVTTAQTTGVDQARIWGVPHTRRDIFLDNEPNLELIARQLQRTEEIARRSGHAIAIGHPNDETIEALLAWLPTLRAKGFALVPVSAIVRENGYAG